MAPRGAYVSVTDFAKVIQHSTSGTQN